MPNHNYSHRNLKRLTNKTLKINCSGDIIHHDFVDIAVIWNTEQNLKTCIIWNKE